MTTLEFLFVTFDFLFPFWPFLVLNAIKGKRHILRDMLITWGFWAVVRVVLFFNPNPLSSSLFIPEPLNTVLFFVSGVVLAGLYFGKRVWQRKRLLWKAENVGASEELLELSPREFEEMVVELFSAYGHQAKRTGAVGDHGVDVVVETKEGEICIVQCKRWKGSVGEPVIRDFYGVLLHEKADHGAIVTSSTFSGPAREWARGKPIALYDGNKLIQLWKRVQAEGIGVPEPVRQS